MKMVTNEGEICSPGSWTKIILKLSGSASLLKLMFPLGSWGVLQAQVMAHLWLWIKPTNTRDCQCVIHCYGQHCHTVCFQLWKTTRAILSLCSILWACLFWVMHQKQNTLTTDNISDPIIFSVEDLDCSLWLFVCGTFLFIYFAWLQ